MAGLAAAMGGVEWPRPTAVQDWQRAVVILAFGALAAHLLLGSRRDARAEHLGTLLLLIGLFFAHPPIQALANALPAEWGRVVLGIRSVTVDAFTAMLAWMFVRDFPRALEWPRIRAFVRTMVAISAIAALGLICANVAIVIRGEPGALAPLARTDPYGHYWTVVFGPLLPVLPFVLWRTRHAPRDERRRVRLFAGGVVAAGLLPVLVAVAGPFSPALRDVLRSSDVLVSLNLLMILAIAATTTYSVVVQQVLRVRTILRKAAQYWLAAGVVAALAGIPFALLLGLLYQARGEPLASLFLGASGLRIVALLAAGGIVLRLRRQVMLAVDRVFLREPYDRERILSSFTAEGRAAASAKLLARTLVEQVETALHPESIGVLVAPPLDGDFVPVAPGLRSLPRESALAKTLARHAGPLDIDLARPGMPLRGMTDPDRIWLGDAGASLLVPLMGSGGTLEGVLVLGPKRNELPYSREDRLLLRSLEGAAGIGLENRRLRGSVSPDRTPAVESHAAECAACGYIAAAVAPRCPECGGALHEAALPRELFGKFQLERRIGQGGMGVVYSAMDLALERRVALKTLPRTNPEHTELLRREARAMAAITHPNLALILGAETWQATPVLVLEYLAGGTLETRLRNGPLAPGRAFEIAYAMAQVLERLHASGLLHRDVKPSNVGFSAEDEPKLLDFGLVRILADMVPARRNASEVPIAETGLAGTPLYMSPEALSERHPESGFDLWGLAVVAFEAMTGIHPFERATPSATLAAIRSGWTDELGEHLPPGVPGAPALFETALARERSRRPATAGEMAERLRKTLGD